MVRVGDWSTAMLRLCSQSPRLRFLLHAHGTAETFSVAIRCPCPLPSVFWKFRGLNQEKEPGDFRTSCVEPSSTGLLYMFVRYLYDILCYLFVTTSTSLPKPIRPIRQDFRSETNGKQGSKPQSNDYYCKDYKVTITKSVIEYDWIDKLMVPQVRAIQVLCILGTNVRIW